MRRLAGDDHSLSQTHNLKTPDAVITIARSIRDRRPLPAGVVVQPGVYLPNLPFWLRVLTWIRPKAPCKCRAREKWLNSISPRWFPLGTLFRWFTTITGIKWVVDRWYSQSTG